MLALKPKHLLTTALFSVFGMAYFTAFSSLEVNAFLKSYAAIIPLQFMALLYICYWSWGKKA